MALAGMFLGLAFYAPGGIWTAFGAHLGWNATLAALDAPVSGLPFRIPFINYDAGTRPGSRAARSGRRAACTATVALLAGCAVTGEYARKDGTA